MHPPNSTLKSKHAWPRVLEGESLAHVAFPMGGMGAGTLCMEGTGALSHVSLRNAPDVFNEPYLYSALWVRDTVTDRSHARVLEGPVPGRKCYGTPGAWNGMNGRTYGLPRFEQATFSARFPFCQVNLTDPGLPVDVAVEGWSPFVPGDADSASLPVVGIAYTFTNTSDHPVEAVYSFAARNPMITKNRHLPNVVLPLGRGIAYRQEGCPEAPWEEGGFYVGTDAKGATRNCRWFRGGWFDAQTLAWRDIANGCCADRPPPEEGPPSPGGTLAVPFTLMPGETYTARLQIAWHVPCSSLRCGPPDPGVVNGSAATYTPWYASRFADLEAVATYWHQHYDALREASEKFATCFHDTSLPPVILEAVSANLSILKSPTLLRQADGRLWFWEGCGENDGSCYGSCTHVQNYAQAIAHLFPELERGLRETEYNENQDATGRQAFRTPLPIRPASHDFLPAADGQLGGIIKAYRDWRISGDTKWVRRLWPKIKSSLEFAIRTWDPGRTGMLTEPQHNTYDIEFWGANGMLTTCYLVALKAAIEIGGALGEDVSPYPALLDKGLKGLQRDLFNGSYFIQQTRWTGMVAGDPTLHKGLDGAAYTPEARDLLTREGPKYQYGDGCLSDGIIGIWFARMSGLAPLIDPQNERSHLASVYAHNLRRTLTAHVNLQRPGYACGSEGGLLLCSWPKADKPTLPFVYSDEVWTGIEYEVGGHLIMTGMIRQGLDVIETCRARYDGRVRNPFNEYECGYWYIRALSSYGLLQAYGGARYDAVTRTLHLAPAVEGDLRVFLCTATGYGTVGIRNGEPFVEVAAGHIDVKHIRRGHAGTPGEGFAAPLSEGRRCDAR